MREPIYEWNEDAGIAECAYVDNMNRTFSGVAMCHPEDKDIMSWRNGYSIAEYRARIAYAKTKRDDAKIALDALNQLYYSVKHSSKYNEKDYMAKMLQRQIQLRKDEYDGLRGYLKQLKYDFKWYMNKMDEINAKYRKYRDNPEALAEIKESELDKDKKF